MAGGAVGIIANPASGKDIRRLVAHASVFDNVEKRNILRRVLLGAAATGAGQFFYMPDPNGLVSSALDELDIDGCFEAVESPRTASALDTERAAAAMRDAGCAAVVTLGGDGTNRAVVRGWRDAPLIAISTGTNNVFPVMVEGTLAGAAAGLVATGVVSMEEASLQAKTVHVEIDGDDCDLALIDAVLLDERWVGSRAIWQPDKVRAIVLARAEPASLGISAVGGLLHPVTAADDRGLVIEVGEGGRELLAPIVPGQYAAVPVRAVRPLGPDESVELPGPGVLAFDGERERRLKPGDRARLYIRRDGPRVIDIERVLRLAACRGAFIRPGGGDADGD